MKIIFVCLGNICRSPMAEMIAKDFIKKYKINNLIVDSCGTTNYHEGENMHYSTKQTLLKNKINIDNFTSKPISKINIDDYDYILVMDNQNYQDVIKKLFDNNKIKIKKIIEYSDFDYSEVPDPWYTNNFDETYKILSNAILNFLKEQKFI